MTATEQAGFPHADRKPVPPPAMRGFEHINRYWDPVHKIFAAKLLPGEYYVTVASELVVTVLGSCVSACIRDRIFGIGGMNHFMLPVNQSDPSSGKWGGDLNASTRYGSFAMERLINDILKNGGSREHLEIKLFGGGRILAQMTDIGNRNIEFVRGFLVTEGLKVAAEDLGDVYPRKVYYFPKTGMVRLMKLRSLHNNTIIDREIAYRRELENQPVAGEVDLF
jgi:chemotaxis protein CheD